MSHCEGKPHLEAAQRFRKWEDMFAEEGTVATRVRDLTGVNGYSVFTVQCAVCRSRPQSTEDSDADDSYLILAGNKTRYCINVFKKHCNTSATHRNLCDQQKRLPLPRALQGGASGASVSSFFNRCGPPSPHSTIGSGASSGAAASSSGALLGSSSSAPLIAASDSAVATAVSPQNMRQCTGLVSGGDYYALAICFSAKATNVVGGKAREDALLEYFCVPDREACTAIIHHRTCTPENKCNLTIKRSTELIKAINQRAERATLTYSKIECLDLLLQGLLIPEELKYTVINKGPKADKEK